MDQMHEVKPGTLKLLYKRVKVFQNIGREKDTLSRIHLLRKYFSFCLFWPLPMCLFLFYHIVLYCHPLDACLFYNEGWKMANLNGEEVDKSRWEWRLLPNSNHELTGNFLWGAICSIRVLLTFSKNGSP